MKKSIILCALVSIAVSAYAQERDDMYFEVSDVSIKVAEIKEGTGSYVLRNENLDVSKVAPVAAAGAIINTGAAAWNIINNGQAVGNLQHYYANAIPSPLTWTEVVGWKGPKEIVYSISFTNLYGIKVLDMEYVIAYFYGGNVKGKGQYISNFTIKPRKFDMSWGFKCNMSLQISNPMNIGSAEDPLAYLQADLNWEFSSPIKKTRGFETYAVYGNGKFEDIGNKSKSLTKDIGELQLPEAVNFDWNK